MTAYGYNFSVGDDEKVLKLDYVMIAQLYKYTEKHWIICFNMWTLWYVNYVSKKLWKITYMAGILFLLDSAISEKHSLVHNMGQR